MGDQHPASFRDPSGFVFRDANGELLRQVQPAYAEAYDELMASGLHAELTGAGLLVAHEEVAVDRAARPGAYRVLRPEPVPFVSHPYEWCFAQLHAAALATLEIQLRAIERGMTLKDASAYNVQFVGTRPVFIDTLSFEPLEEGRPWVAYRQFCQHFVAPLALAALRDIRLLRLLRTSIDGVPLDLAARLLPRRTRLRFGLASHIHLHARFQQQHAAGGAESSARAAKATVSKRGLVGLLESLKSTVEGLRWRAPRTEWGAYYADTNYSDAAFAAKHARVAAMLEAEAPNTVIDLGANNGEFSRLAAARGAYTIACDVDPVAVEDNYTRAVRKAEGDILPLWIDLTNPSPGLGLGARGAGVAGRGAVRRIARWRSR